MSKLEKLNRENISQISISTKNSITNVPNKIVHIGIGAFHRAHQALFTELTNNLSEEQWGVIGISLRSATTRDVLKGQDYLYSVMEKSPEEKTLRLISCIRDVIVAPSDQDSALNSIVDKNTKIVSFTVTEKGYCQKNSKLDINHPDIITDLEAGTFTSMPAFVAKALHKRWLTNGLPLTLLSCDNLPNNGIVLRNVILDYARLLDESLVLWIEQSVSFCSTMVDRIVPASTLDSQLEVSQALGLEDKAAILCEPFKQWVIEDNFCTNRPAWEKAGALVVKDVESYEKLKLRFLNGCHSFIAYCGMLYQDEFIHETFARTEVKRFVRELSLNEMAKSLNIPNGVDPAEYSEKVASRFSNYFVPYKNSQVAKDGSLKLPQRCLLPMQDLLKSGMEFSSLSFALSVWVAFLIEAHKSGCYSISDPNSDRLLKIVSSNSDDLPAIVDGIFLSSGLFSISELYEIKLKEDLIHYIDQINKMGIEAAINLFHDCYSN